MKKVIIIFFLSGWTFMLYSQSCLPEGITFTSQSQIDSFPIMYPGCAEIEGDLTIEMGNIDNLSALISITKINGDLEIRHTTLLNSLSGLDNLQFILGFLDIYNNSGLTSLGGLNGIKMIGTGVFIEQNSSLSNLHGLNNLERVEERFFIWDNDALLSLDGLHMLGFIGTSFEIRKNDVLENIDALQVLDSIGEGILIRENSSLTNIMGLNALVYTGGGVDIGLNPQLNSLHGLENLSVVGHELGIWGLGIYGNDKLTDLSGLDNMLVIKSGLFIQGNNMIEDLNGLQNLTSIGGMLSISDNPALVSIEQLVQLTTIGSSMSIEGNTSLKSLSGLDNVAASSITNLYVRENDSLHECEVKSVCDYLADPNGFIIIETNTSGCNSQTEVELACESQGILQLVSDPQLSAYPNPFTTSTTIEYELYTICNIQYTVYNMMGDVVFYSQENMLPPGRHKITWSPGHLPAGLYYGVLRSGDSVSVVKLIKQ
jgi:hypothetical protein